MVKGRASQQEEIVAPMSENRVVEEGELKIAESKHKSLEG
jgi:hypothetical protein